MAPNDGEKINSKTEENNGKDKQKHKVTSATYTTC